MTSLFSRYSSPRLGWRGVLRRASQVLLLLVLVFSPLAFATTEVWSMAVAQAMIFAATLCFLLAAWPGGEATASYRTPGMFFLLLLGGFMLAQLLPLPPAALALLSPVTFEMYSDTVWVVAPGSWQPLSLHRAGTVEELLRFAACVALYYLSVQLLSGKEFLHRTLRVVAGLAGIIAFVAILQKFTAPDMMYWFRHVSGASVTGPWVYRNHYAGYMEMALPVVVALFLLSRPQVQYRQSWRRRLAEFFTLPQFHQHLLFGLAAVLMAISVFISLSRGGILSMSLSMLAFAVLAVWRTSLSRVGLWASVALLLVLLGVSWFGWQPIMDRFQAVFNAQGQLDFNRLPLWQDTLAMLRDFPLWGTGFGAFADAFNPYRTLPGSSFVDHAHNDYLELLANGGIVAGILAAGFFALLFASFFRQLRRRRDSFSVLVGLGAFSGVLALLIHGISDFNLHNGANAFAFFFTCGLMVAASAIRLRGHSRLTLLDVRQPGLLLPASALLIALLLAGSLWYNLGLLRGDIVQQRLDKVYLSNGMRQDRLHALLGQADDAVTAAPLEALHHFSRGNILVFLGRMDHAMASFARAIQLRPLECLYLQRVGHYLSGTRPEEANRLYEAASRLNQGKIDCQLEHARWLFQQQRRGEALAAMQRVLELEGGGDEKLVRAFMGYSLTPEEIVIALPERVAPYLAFARHFWQESRQEVALELYLRGMSYLGREADVQPWYFQLGYSWLQHLGRKDEAVALLRQGIEVLPRHADFHVHLGDIYLKEGIRFRALEEYDKALVLRPDDVGIQRKLAQARGE